MVMMAKDEFRGLILEMTAAGGKAPEMVQLIPFGKRMTLKGPMDLDAAGAEELMQYYKDTSTDPVVDYEHQTEGKDVAPAAGWITSLENRGADGIWGTVQWCKRAEKMLIEREYRYLSPVMVLEDKTHRVRRFLRAALTNAPAIDGMKPVVAKQDVNGGNAVIQEEDKKKMEKILIALGLKATATEDEGLAAIEALKTAAGNIPVACKGLMTALGLKDNATESDAVGTVMAFKSGSDRVGDLAGKVNDLTAKLAAKEAEELVTVAMKEGKVSPGQKDWALKYAKDDQEGFKTFCAKAVPVVSTNPDPKQPAPAPEGDTLTASEILVCKQTGVTEEAYKAHKKTISLPA